MDLLKNSKELRLFQQVFMMLSSFILLVMLFSVLIKKSESLHCLNENGETVEWWVIYKANAGINYAYYDATNVGKTLNLMGKLLSSQNTALGYTLNEIWKNPTLYDYIAYNVCFLVI